MNTLSLFDCLLRRSSKYRRFSLIDVSVSDREGNGSGTDRSYSDKLWQVQMSGVLV